MSGIHGYTTTGASNFNSPYANEFYEGGPAVTFRKLGKGTVTYVGVDSHNGALEKDILKKLYAQLSIPVMDLPYGVTVEYRNGLGIKKIILGDETNCWISVNAVLYTDVGSGGFS